MEKFRKVVAEILSEEHLSQSKMAKMVGIEHRAYFNQMLHGQRPFNDEYQSRIKSKFPKYFSEPPEIKLLNKLDNNDNLVAIKFRPDVYLSAGYGAIVSDEQFETVHIDKKLLISKKGLTINPKYCEVLTVSGDSMLPDYHHGDRVVLDKSITEFIDGQVFAFIVDGQCYIKTINILPNKIKCIPLNKEYDTFYLDRSTSYKVLGLIVPRLRF